MSEEELTKALRESLTYLADVTEKLEEDEEYIEFTKDEENMDEEAVVDWFINKYLKKLDNFFPGDSKKQLLALISNDFMSKNGLFVGDIFSTSQFDQLIGFFMQSIDDKTNEFKNGLLKSTGFMEVYGDAPSVVKELILNCKDEDLIFSTIKRLDRENDAAFGIMVSHVLGDPDISAELKDKILNDSKILNAVTSFYLERIITEGNLSYEQKLKMLLDERIFTRIEPWYLASAMGATINNQEDRKRIIFDERVLGKLSDVNIAEILAGSKMTYFELTELFYDERIYSKLGNFSLDMIIGDADITFEERKNLLFDARNYSRLNDSDFTQIISSKKLNNHQRKELLFDSRIQPRLYDFHYGTVVNSENLTIEEKIELLNDERIFQRVGREEVEKVITMDSLSLEQATKLMLDDRIFYKAIGESPDQEGTRYDKKAYMLKLYEMNPYIAKTLTYGLFKDDILDNGFAFIERMSKYPSIADKLVNMYESYPKNAVFFSKMCQTIENNEIGTKINKEAFTTRLIGVLSGYSFSGILDKLNSNELNSEQYKVLTGIILRSKSIYNKGVRTGFLKFVDEIDKSLNIDVDVNSASDLDSYEQRRRDKCDSVISGATDLITAKNAYFNKYFNINYEEAMEIVRLYGTSIEELRNNPDYSFNYNYIDSLRLVLDAEKLDTIREIYSSQKESLSFEQTLYIDQSFRQLYSRSLSSSAYKTEGIPNGYLESNGVRIPVYEPQGDFRMLVHSTNAYGKLELLNNNYFDSWNKSDKVTNHGICCSYIASNNMGIAEVKDVLFGFDEWDDKAVQLMAPYDIYSSNDNYELEEGRPLLFLTAQTMVDNTRHTHNEVVLERRELRKSKQNDRYPNVQPSYVIIYSDMDDKAKEKAIKAAADMSVPIVYLDKKVIAERESSKIEHLRTSFGLSGDLSILKQMITEHENNRSGYRITNPELIEQYFPTERVDSAIASAIQKVKRNAVENSISVSEYCDISMEIMRILDEEKKKFDVTNESGHRINNIDLPIDLYKRSLMQFATSHYELPSSSKLESITSFAHSDNVDTDFDRLLRQTDTQRIHEEMEDIASKGLYSEERKGHDIDHIEKVMFFSELLGEREQLSERERRLLLEAAKYHDCGRENGAEDKNHAKRSAQLMLSLLDDGYSEADKKLISLAVEYHEEKDSDLHLEDLCDEYNLSDEERIISKRISNCLKDADALDRTRFSNPHATLDTDYLRTESAKKMVPVAYELQKRYKTIDYRILQELAKNHGLSTVEIGGNRYE